MASLDTMDTHDNDVDLGRDDGFWHNPSIVISDYIVVIARITYTQRVLTEWMYAHRTQWRGQRQTFIHFDIQFSCI